MGCHILLTGKFKDLTNFSKPDFFLFLDQGMYIRATKFQNCRQNYVHILTISEANDMVYQGVN